jgi:A/G-specific adenine glycosylase
MNYYLNNTTKYFIKRKLLKWHSENCTNSYPWRTTENHWHAIVAEIMLQRTNAEQVKPVYENFVESFSDARAFLRASHAQQSHDIFSSLGLRWRLEKLQKLAELISKHGIPQEKNELVKLPGIGDYVASAFLSMHLYKREPIVDSNIIRFYGRFFGFKTDGEIRRKKWLKELAEKVTPKENSKDFNYALLDFSMQICKKKPSCANCVLSGKCEYYRVIKYELDPEPS